MRNILLLIIYLFCTQAGVILIKLGSENTDLGLRQGAIFMSFSWQTLLGLALYVASFLLFVHIVGKYNLSYIIPLLGGVGYIITLVLSVAILRENVSVTQILGIFVVIIGIVLMNVKKPA
ncbi:MAG: hypothetical protein LBM98_06330 [Oscillospiraceae bacterium]|jgi:multidrug transporter EmrE-like cation transporter|nr:hypothetical protein [Oscillospiraceae bacterium]